jgi:tetratricopeptide (TPR) repeat protein
LVLAIVLAYLGGLGAPFHFDDHESITDNPSIRELTSLAWLNPPAIRGETVSGRPLLNFSFALNHALGGFEVREFRATNILIHALAALTLFGLVRRTARRMSATENPAIADGFALAITALWALHPLQTGAVTYIVQRAESLAGLFTLLTLYGFVRATEAPAPRRWFWLSVISCFGGVLTKETVATAPLLALLYDRAFVAGSLRAAWRARWRIHVALASSWLVLGALVLMNHGRGGSAGLNAAITPWTYLLTQGGAIARYLELTIWPRGQIFDYGMETAAGLADVWLPALMLTAFAMAAGWALVRNRVSGFLAAAFFLLLAPSSSVIPVATQTIAEHRMYLPLAAVLLLLGHGAVRVSDRLRGRISGRLAALVVAGLALALAVTTAARNQVYRSERSLWQDTVNQRPNNPRAHHNLGLALAAAGESDAAIAEFRRTIALQPNHAFALAALGEALRASGKAEEAIAHFRAALAADPGYVPARVNLGRALGALGRLDEAMAEYEAVLAVEPQAVDVRTNIATLLIARGALEQAAAMLRAVIAAAPRLAEAHYNLGVALDKLQRPAEAETEFGLAVQQKTDFTAAWLALANIRARRGAAAEAEQAYREALRLDARSAEAHYGLGNILAQRREFAAAIEEFMTALAIDPAHVRARNNLGNCQLVTGRVREAIATYEESLRLRPGDSTVEQNLELARGLLRQGGR